MTEVQIGSPRNQQARECPRCGWYAEGDECRVCHLCLRRAKVFLCLDGGWLCPECARENLREIVGASSDCPDDHQWYIIGGVRGSVEGVRCDHCYREIE